MSNVKARCSGSEFSEIEKIPFSKEQLIPKQNAAMPTCQFSFQRKVSWLAGSQSNINEEGPIHSVQKGCWLAEVKPES